MRRTLILSIAIVASIFLTGIVFASTTIGLNSNKNYAINVVNDGSESVKKDENLELQTKVVQQNDTEITLETSVKSVIEKKNKEVAIVVDSSYSMETNSKAYDIKNIATQLSKKILIEVPDVKISIIDNNGVKSNLTTVQNTITDAINTIKFNNGNSIANGLNKAKEILKSGNTVNKYVIVLTDATDNAKTELEKFSESEDNKIKVYSVLADITSSAFGNINNPVPEDGTVYMMENFDQQDLVDDINKTIKDISVNNIFNEDILRSSTRGNFKLEILNNETVGNIEQLENGSINWKIDSLKAGEIKKAKYKLKLNTSSTIGTDFLYNDIKIIKKMDLKYKSSNQNSEKEILLENAEPIIQICDAYNLKINAVGKDTTVPVEGVKFDVTGINEEGKTIVEERDLVSDKDGNVIIHTIKPLGTINYTITPHVENLIGYEETNPVQVTVDNGYTSSGGNLTVSYFDTEKFKTDDTNGKREVFVEVPIELQKFKVIVDLSDLSDPDTKLPGVDFRLIQPKLNNIYEMDALYGTTDANGMLEFNASIMSANGTYEYILSQTSDKDGYENIGNPAIKITFDDYGKVVENGVKVLFNANIEGTRISDSEVLLKVKAKCNSSNMFNINMNLNDEQTNDPIEGTIYDIMVTKINSSNTGNSTMTYTKVTDSNGNINFKAIGSESGYTKIVIHENTPNDSYIKETNDKEIIINRQGEIIYEITTGGDYTIKDPDNNNGIIVNLTSKEKSELNIIRMHLTQKDDTGLNLLNVPMQLKDVTPNGNNTGRVYSATTNVDGYAEFILEDPQTITDGIYYFEVSTTYLPVGYDEPGTIATIKVSILNQRVKEITDVTDTKKENCYDPIANPTILNENKDTTISNIAYADYTLTPDANSTSYVKVKLLDADNKTPIENGKYEITMERDGAQIANAGSRGKYTDKNGYTNKMSIPGLDSNHVIITIAQVYDATRQNGHKVDTNVYKIEVHKNDDGSIGIDSATLNDGTELPNGIEASYEDSNGDKINDTVVFEHLNTIINPGDVILDFSVIKYDYITKLPDQSQNLIVWSDDFKIYDESKGEYEEFGENNPYNPFITGITSNNTYSSGQIDVRLKPDKLPEVVNKDRDGYPTGGAILHIGEYNSTTKKVIEGTEYQIKINFTYSKETGTYKYSGYSNLSNWALLKDFHHSASQNSGEGYVESAVLELWSNYGETANFAIDFSKYNYLDQELQGARYNVKVALPTGKYISLTQDILNGDDTIEIPNLYVKEGSIITITEETAPIGYELDKQEMSFNIEKIDANTGLMTISKCGVENDRITLEGTQLVTTDADNNIKCIQKIKLVDLEKNNTKFGITTKDKNTQEATKGNSYKFVTNTGNSAISNTTNEEGKVTTLIGGEKKRDYMEYTISQDLSDQTQVTQYYKRLAQDIKVRVYFDDNGNIDNDPNSPNFYGTLCKEIDPNYGETWYIDSVNAENRINVVILQEREDPLNVNIETKDAFTNTILNNAEYPDISTYEITPTTVLEGKGETSAQVGYVDPGKTVTYTLKSTVCEKYIGIQDQQFIVTYDNEGNVTSAEVAPESDNIEIETNNTNLQTVDITVKIEPAVPFVIHNVDYYDNSKNLQNTTFEIERENDRLISSNKTTNSEGNAVCFDGAFGTGTSDGNQRVIYIVRQTSAANTYATVEEFKIEVEYDQNREIKNAIVYNKTASTNKLITISHKQPSTSADIGYNGNDKGIVTIEVKNYPAFNIEFTNVDRVDNSKLQGSKYDIKSSILKYPLTNQTDYIMTQTNGTDANGVEMAYVDRTSFGGTATYEIKNIQAANGYQKIRSTIKIEVKFDENGYINIEDNDPVRIVEGSEYAEVQIYKPTNTNSENFGIKLIIKSSPIFRINIDNIDRKDCNNNITTNLAGAEYSIISDYDTSVEVVKISTNTVIAMLGETPINQDVVYTVKEKKPSVGYQTIEKDIIIKVHFDINGCVDSVVFEDQKNSAYATVNKVTKINTNNTADKFTIDLSIKNNPLIELDLNKMNEDGAKLNNIQFNIKGKIEKADDIIFEQNVTTISGLGDFKIDRALDNTTIVYTITEIKNTAGYQYVPSELTMKVTYDSEGRIAKDSNNNYLVELTPQVTWAKITKTTDYGIGLDVTNERIKEIGINLNTIDKYDDSKKAEKAEIKAYFTKDNVSFNEDENHSTKFITGRDDDNDGIPDFDHGQDYKTLGKAENIVKNEIEGIKTATLVLKEVKTPNTYYDTTNNVSKDNIYMNWSYYGVSSVRIDMTFTDEGKIKAANLHIDSVGSTSLGKLLDSQYVKVSIDQTNPYMLNIDLRYYPMLEMTINAVSDDTYSKAADNNDNDLIGTYRVSSRHYDDDVSIYKSTDENRRNGLVTAGYIGTSQLRGIVPSAQTRDSKVLNNNTNTYDANNYALWVGEQFNVNNSSDIANNGRIRYIYISEPNNEAKSEPANNYSGYNQLQYQQHGQRDREPMYMAYNNALIGAIQVTYNEKGEIKEAKILDDKDADSDNRTEQKDNSKYITVDISNNKHGIVVRVQYKRTTTIEAKVTDNITGAELKNITLNPFKGGTVNANRSYTYTTNGNRDLSKGENRWTYWGGNDSNGDRKYVIGTKFNNSTMYNGYDTIGDIQLDIHYDEYGYVDINNSKVLSTNANGDPNAIIERVDKDKVYLNIIASRRFDVQIDKKDLYDNSKTLTDARFSIKSTKTDIRGSNGQFINTKTNIYQGTRTQVGLIHKSETITYTISETFTPEGYYTIDTFDMDVVFDENGVISKIMLKDGTILYDVFGIHTSKNVPIKIISIADKYKELKPQNITDLRFELYNIPKFTTNITLKDEFYKNEPIEGVTYSITNDTHSESATGNPTTDSNGKISTFVGTVYPKETVTYTIKQTMTANRYYEKKSDIKVDVTFDDNGYVSDYTVTQGNDKQSEVSVVTNKRGLNFIIYNKPKDMKIGIEKYDQLTKGKLEGVGFKITRQEISSEKTSEYSGETDTNGNITETVDIFDNQKEVLYTISETKQLEAYRKIEDVIIRVKYDDDGRVSYYNVDSNPSNVDIRVANSNFETLANGDKVHIKVSIPNDDTYDLIVKDEDKNIHNLGIKGTIYDVSINGNEQQKPKGNIEKEQLTTNDSGMMYLRNRTEAGDISIKVSEATIGTGYRKNVSNSAELTFAKGVNTYSLDLETNSLANRGYNLISGPDDIYDTNYKDGKSYTIELNSTDKTQVIVGVYEGTGKITMTFKNDSKSMLNLRKIDAETGKVLEGAKFEITSQEVDSYGNAQGQPSTITSNITTDKDGMAYVDLGIRHPNKKIRYTFKEVTPPSGYIAIEDVTLTCTYDGNGRISSKVSNSKRIGADNSWFNINTTIKNGDLETYSVKVVSVDSRKGSTATGTSNNRINGSKFDITIKDDDGTILAQENNEATKTLPDSFGYEEDGIITISGLKAEGNISVDINQTELMREFIRGDNKTTGTVTFDNSYVKANDQSKPEVSLSNLNNDGFVDSYINSNDNEIVIKVYNDPQVKFNLHKEDIDTGEPIEGATFTITSEIDGQNKIATVPTDLNVTTQGTDSEGNETAIIGAPEYGKTVIYTIRENKIKDYDQLDDAKIKVTYDTAGQINDWEILSDESYTEIKEYLTTINGKASWKTYTKEEENELKENNKIGHLNTKGSRQLNTLIKNKATDRTVPYTIIVEAQDELRNPVQNIGIDLDVKHGKGNNPIYPTKVTNSNGQAIYTADGSDRIEMNITIVASQSYTFNENLNCIAYKNTSTGEISITQNNNIYPEVDNEKHIIKLVILCETPQDKYSINIMKMDKTTNTTIVDNPAIFTINKLIPTEDDNDPSTEDYIEETIGSNMQTNESGMLSLSMLDMPSEPGTYTYRVYERQAPNGYKNLKEPIDLDVTFSRNSTGDIVITDIVSKDKNNLYVVKKADKGFVIAINNNEAVPDDQYMLNIFKVDSKTEERLDGAIFKVNIPNSTDTSVYVESGENTENAGQLDYCYVEQDKDYETRLKQMRRPTIEEVKTSENQILTHTYTFQEVAAPEEYDLNKTEVNLNIDFEVVTDGNGNEVVKIKDATSDNTEIMEVKEIQDDQIMAEIYNKKQIKSYTVHYDANTTDSVNSLPGDQLKIEGTTLTIDSNIPTRDGYTFVEWNTQQDGNGTSFQPGGSYSADADLTLYAKWEIAQYIVHYEPNVPVDKNGNPVGTPKDIPLDQQESVNNDIIIDDLSIYTNPPSLNGYQFKEWNTKSDGTGDSYKPNDVYTENKDVTLYAIWESNNDLYLRTQKYKIGENNTDEYEEGDIYFYRVNPYTTLTEFISNCDTNGTITVYKKSGEELGENELIGTGMTLKDEKDGKTITLILSVKGDIDGNGKVTATDLAAMNQQILKEISLDEAQFMAADISDDKKVTATDLAAINQVILKELDLSTIK